MIGKIKRVIKHDSARDGALREEIERGGGIEKKDIPAMVLSAYLTVIPVIILVLGVFALIAYLYVS